MCLNRNISRWSDDLHVPVSATAWRCSWTTAAASQGTAGSCKGPDCSPGTGGKPRCESTWGSSRSATGSSSRRCSGCWRSPSSRCWAPTRSGARWWRWRSPGRPSSPEPWRDTSLLRSRSAPETSWRTCLSGWPCFGCSYLGRRAGKSPRQWQWPASSERVLEGDREEMSETLQQTKQNDRKSDISLLSGTAVNPNSWSSVTVFSLVLLLFETFLFLTLWQDKVSCHSLSTGEQMQSASC